MSSELLFKLNKYTRHSEEFSDRLEKKKCQSKVSWVQSVAENNPAQETEKLETFNEIW